MGILEETQRSLYGLTHESLSEGLAHLDDHAHNELVGALGELSIAQSMHIESFKPEFTDYDDKYGGLHLSNEESFLFEVEETSNHLKHLTEDLGYDHYGPHNIRITMGKESPQVFEDLNAMMQGIAEGSPMAAYYASLPIFIESQQLVPVNTGALKRSGYITLDLREVKAVVTIGYAAGGNPEYAEYVHENAAAYHEPPTQSHFLSTAAALHMHDVGPRAEAFLHDVVQTADELKLMQYGMRAFKAIGRVTKKRIAKVTAQTLYWENREREEGYGRSKYTAQGPRADHPSTRPPPEPPDLNRPNYGGNWEQRMALAITPLNMKGITLEQERQYRAVQEFLTETYGSVTEGKKAWTAAGLAYRTNQTYSIPVPGSARNFLGAKYVEVTGDRPAKTWGDFYESVIEHAPTIFSDTVAKMAQDKADRAAAEARKKRLAELAERHKALELADRWGALAGWKP